MLTEVLWYASVIVGVYILSITIAWLINRRELKRIYGRAPFNWRIYGWIYLYPPYLRRLQQKDKAGD